MKVLLARLNDKLRELIMYILMINSLIINYVYINDLLLAWLSYILNLHVARVRSSCWLVGSCDSLEDMIVGDVYRHSTACHIVCPWFCSLDLFDQITKARKVG